MSVGVPLYIHLSVTKAIVTTQTDKVVLWCIELLLLWSEDFTQVGISNYLDHLQYA